MKIFWPKTPVGAVAAAFGAGRERAEVGARLRLRQVHGAGPFARHHARQVERLQRIAAVPFERLDRPGRQQRAEREGHACAVPHLRRGGGKRERQPLAADRLRRGDAGPAAGPPARRRRAASRSPS